MSEQLTIREPGEMPVARPQPTVAEMLAAVIQKGVTQENVAAVGEIVKLYERVEEKNAEKSFARAFVALQNDLPAITAKSMIPNRGKYEKFEDLMVVVGPLLAKHGFSVSFSMDFKEGRVLEICQLSHIDGHSRSNSFAVRTARADSDTQADCKAATTAKRFALCNALNIVIRQDALTSEEDASIEGGPVSQEIADELERRVKETNSDVKSFLRYAGADSFKTIPASRYDDLDQMLARKERR